MINESRELHTTPNGTIRPFTWTASFARPRLPIDICPLNNDSETASYPAPSSSTTMSSSGGSTSPDQPPVAADADIRYCLVCHEGHSSSLAAATLRELGLHRATDLLGGFQTLLAMLRTNARPTNVGAARTHSQPTFSPMSKCSVLSRPRLTGSLLCPTGTSSVKILLTTHRMSSPRPFQNGDRHRRGRLRRRRVDDPAPAARGRRRGYR
jgi:rhodanese-related sulfurtransferase